MSRSLLDYFKQKTLNTDRPLPNPQETLSRVIPSAAILSANREVQEVYDCDQDSNSSEVAPKSRKGKKPRVYSPKKRAEIGKLACNDRGSEKINEEVWTQNPYPWEYYKKDNWKRDTKRDKMMMMISELSVNKVVKSLLQNKFSDWYANEIIELFIDGEDTVVDVSTTRMICVVGEWIVQVFEHLQANTQIIVHGFRHAGVFDVLGIIEDDELPEYGDDLESDDDSELDEWVTEFFM